MDYEKAFKDAYERASLRFGTNVANELFLEYKESKEERTRRKLIEFFSDWSKTKSHCWGIRVTDIMDWLEKQGEQKPFDYENATIVQKDFAPNEEPKFNIGDWIVSDLEDVNEDFRLCEIIGIEDGCYTIQSANGCKEYNFFEIWESDYHLWSIEDAKDGDVLSSELCGTIMLYKGIEDNNIQFYCDYDFSDIDVPGARFAINNGQHYGSVDDFDDWHPATKEQRDLLFQKIREAGYEWDSEKKELKLLITNGGDFDSKNCELNPAWSEEDEKNSYHLKTLLENLTKDNKYEFRIISDNDRDKYTTWLESIKDRVHPQNHWKPSEKQIEALEDEVRNNKTVFRKKVLNELLEQLKKL